MKSTLITLINSIHRMCLAEVEDLQIVIIYIVS